MTTRKEFLPDPDNSGQNNVLIKFLSSGWRTYKIVSLERINSNDEVHLSGWVVTHIMED